MKTPVEVWTRYDDGSIDYMLVEKPVTFWQFLKGFWE